MRDRKPEELAILVNLDPATLTLRGADGKVDELILELDASGGTLARVSMTRSFGVTEAERAGFYRQGVGWPERLKWVDGAARVLIVIRDVASKKVGTLSVGVGEK